MKKILLFLLCLHVLNLSKVECQTKQTDKFTLLTTPYNNRPLTVFKGQLMINAGYKLALRSKSFDNNGEVINLKKNGNSSVLHDYFFSVRYGLFDFIEVGMEDSFMSRAVRAESVTYASNFGTITTNSLTEYTGMTDFYAYLSLRLPVPYKTFDISVTGGLNLPTSAYKPQEPLHTISEYVDELTYNVNYHYINRNGSGVPFWNLSCSAKLLFSKFAAEASLSYRLPSREGTSIRWSNKLSGKEFLYSSTSYSYLPDETVHTRVALFFQPNGWFNVHLGSEYIKNINGWTEYYGLRYSNLRVSLLTIIPGYEIQVSPSVRISQLAGFTLSGRNTDAPFFMVTSLTYNMMRSSK